MQQDISVIPDIRFIKLPEVLALCGKSKSSIYAAINKGGVSGTGEIIQPLVRLDTQRDNGMGGGARRGQSTGAKRKGMTTT